MLDQMILFRKGLQQVEKIQGLKSFRKVADLSILFVKNVV